MRFVHDEREPLSRQLADFLRNDGELLERGDDDGLAGLQSVLELPGGGVDVFHHPQRLLELAHRRLQLAVQHPPVGNDHNGVENPAVVRIVKRRQLVRQPGDGEGLAAAGRVLNQVAPAASLTPGVSHQLAHAVELLVAGEDEEPLARLPAPVVFLLDLVDELPDQVQDAIGRPGFFPQVGRGVTAPGGRHRWVAGAAELAAIEGQEASLRTRQVGRHVDQIRVNGEVGQAPPVAEQRFPRVAVRPVLANGVLDRLARQRVLELRREDGDAVEEDRQVEALVVLLAVVQLPRHEEEVALVQPLGLFVQPAGRAEPGQPEAATHVADAVAQHVEGAPAGNLGREAFQELFFHQRPVMLGEPLPRLGLGGQYEVKHVSRHEAQSAVVVLGSTLPVAAGRHAQGRNRPFRRSRLRRPGAGTPRWPPRRPARKRLRSCRPPLARQSGR